MMCEQDHTAIWRLFGGIDFLLVKLKHHMDEELSAAGDDSGMTKIIQKDLRHSIAIVARQLEEAQKDLTCQEIRS